MMGGNIFSALNSIEGTTTLTVALLILLAVLIIVKITKLPIFVLIHALGAKFMTIIGKLINKKETIYHRDLEIGKIDEKRTSVKLYRFLNDLIIDLNLKESGITPYELLYATITLTMLGTALTTKIVFGNVFMTIMLGPVATIAIFCFLYTKANLAHDARIEAVIEAENIICNNIKIGVVTAIRESLNTLPKQVQPDFRDFIDNVEYKNYHVKTALQELNIKLGGIADDFIKKCIVFELEEEHGIAGMFADVVEINNIKMQIRIEMKRRFEEVMNEFKVGACMIFVFLGGVLAIYPDVREMYFKTVIGQLILCVDFLIIIAEFVYITYLRAKEL